MRKLGVTASVKGLPVRLVAFALFVIAVSVFIPLTGAFANDTIVRFGAGGIEFAKNDHIRMLEEALKISVKKVKVKYRFLNESNQDIETDVAFPFPSYHPLDLVNIPGGDGAKTIRATFKVLVNGKPVTTKLVRKAVVGGRDIKDQLRKLGLSDEEIFFLVTVENAPVLVEKVNKLRGESAEWWTIEEIAVWKMTFPTGKEIVVEHEYVPAAGGFYEAPFQRGFDRERHPDLWTRLKAYNDEACLDDITRRAIGKRIKAEAAKDPEMVYVSVRDVEYILGTGRNWKGPIGEFTLRVEKEKPDEFVSLCFPGKPKKMSPTVYEFHEKDFVPPDKLVVYFYSVGPEVAQ